MNFERLGKLKDITFELNTGHEYINYLENRMAEAIHDEIDTSEIEQEIKETEWILQELNKLRASNGRA